MKTFCDVIAAWGTVATFAADLGVKERTAMSWFQRKSIPASWFAGVVRAAKARGYLWITPEELIFIAETARAQRLAA